MCITPTTVKTRAAVRLHAKVVLPAKKFKWTKRNNGRHRRKYEYLVFTVVANTATRVTALALEPSVASAYLQREQETFSYTVEEGKTHSLTPLERAMEKPVASSGTKSHRWMVRNFYDSMSPSWWFLMETTQQESGRGNGPTPDPGNDSDIEDVPFPCTNSNLRLSCHAPWMRHSTSK